MRSLLPDARLIYMVRDPLRRIPSHYLHASSERRERRPIDEAVLDEQRFGYVSASRYAWQLSLYLEHFSQERVLVLSLEDLAADTPGAMRRVFAFLGLHADVPAERFRHIANASRIRGDETVLGRIAARALSRRRAWRARRLPVVGPLLYRPAVTPVLAEATAARVKELLAADVAELRRMTGQAFPQWSL
jgi:hypothetical protein